MKFDLNLKKQNPICKAIFERKFGKNNILKIKTYTKTINIRISKISIIISNHVNKVYVRLNKVFNKIKDASKKTKD